MNVVWEYGPLSAKAIHEILKRENAVHDLDSIKTYLLRMSKKGAVDSVRQGRAYSYFAKCEEAPMVLAHLEKFWNSVPKSAQSLALKHIVENTKTMEDKTRSKIISMLDYD